MKVKVLSRNPADHIRQSRSDIHKIQRNLDPSLHPFEAPREYTRALNAVKLERVFAKPFVGSLDGHKDGVYCMARHPRSLSVLLSGSCDGEVGLPLGGSPSRWPFSSHLARKRFSHRSIRHQEFSVHEVRKFSEFDTVSVAKWMVACYPFKLTVNENCGLLMYHVKTNLTYI